jgi:hypothetical protein
LGVGVTLVYPGYFRTEFLTSGSLSLAAQRIDAYTAVRESETKHMEQINGQQPGDPVKAALAMISVYERREPALHLFLGSDAVAMAETKLGQLRTDLDALRAVSVGTDY